MAPYAERISNRRKNPGVNFASFTAARKLAKFGTLKPVCPETPLPIAIFDQKNPMSSELTQTPSSIDSGMQFGTGHGSRRYLRRFGDICDRILTHSYDPSRRQGARFWPIDLGSRIASYATPSDPVEAHLAHHTESLQIRCKQHVEEFHLVPLIWISGPGAIASILAVITMSILGFSMSNKVTFIATACMLTSLLTFVGNRLFIHESRHTTFSSLQGFLFRALCAFGTVSTIFAAYLLFGTLA